MGKISHQLLFLRYYIANSMFFALYKKSLLYPLNRDMILLLKIHLCVHSHVKIEYVLYAGIFAR